MAGHSHWAGIKHKKAVTDAKRSKSFSKLLKAVSAAARSEPNPEFNPRLRTAVQKAREAQVPADTIQRSIDKASTEAEHLEELTFEAYGASGVALIIEATTDNRNRAVAEVKSALNKNGGKIATPGSVLWAFQKAEDATWAPQFPQEVSADDAEALMRLVEALESLEDVQEVTTSAA